MTSLKNIWNSLTGNYTEDGSLIESLWIEIIKAYSSKSRHYHNVSHLNYMIDKAIEYKDLLNHFDTTMFSIFYHDFIYNIRRKDNEQRSAAIAYNCLKKLCVPTEYIENTCTQILATKQHEKSNNRDTNFLLDFDMAILGEPYEIYTDYTMKIRTEYSIYPDLLYIKGRKKVLQHFLTMDYIFKTQEFRDKYEQQAKVNLKRESTLLNKKY